MKDAAALVLMVTWLVLAHRVIARYYRRTGVPEWSPLDGLRNFPFFHFDRSEWMRMGLLTLGCFIGGAVLIEWL